MKLTPLRRDLREYLQRHQLTKKWEKAQAFFEDNIRYSSLYTELLRPHWRGIYSFRLDRRYRALFLINEDGEAEVFQITNHHEK
jgi:hypothetical protein